MSRFNESELSRKIDDTIVAHLQTGEPTADEVSQDVHPVRRFDPGIRSRTGGVADPQHRFRPDEENPGHPERESAATEAGPQIRGPRAGERDPLPRRRRRNPNHARSPERVSPARGTLLASFCRETGENVNRRPKYCIDRVSLSQLYRDRKSTRLNSSHLGISYAVFC